MGVQYKRVHVIKQSWTGEHGSVNVWWSYDSQNPTMRQKKETQTNSRASRPRKREWESVEGESEKGERHGTDLTIK